MRCLGWQRQLFELFMSEAEKHIFLFTLDFCVFTLLQTIWRKYESVKRWERRKRRVDDRHLSSSKYPSNYDAATCVFHLRLTVDKKSMYILFLTATNYM